jgi:hypothetical protein
MDQQATPNAGSRIRSRLRTLVGYGWAGVTVAANFAENSAAAHRLPPGGGGSS